MRCYLQPLPLSRIRYLRQPPPQLSQTRCRPSFRPQRLSRMRPHRAPRQELCSEGQISQTDEVSHKLPQGRPRRRSKCPGLWVGSHWPPLYSTNPRLCLTKAALVEIMMCRGMSRRGDSIDPRHAGPRACAIGRFRRHFDAGPMPCRTRLSVAGEGFEGAVTAAAVAAPTKEHAETFTDPCAHLQG